MIKGNISTAVYMIIALLVLYIFHITWAAGFIRRYDHHIFFVVTSIISVLVPILARHWVAKFKLWELILWGAATGYIIGLVLTLFLEMFLYPHAMENYASSFKNHGISTAFFQLAYPLILGSWVHGAVWALAIGSRSPNRVNPA